MRRRAKWMNKASEPVLEVLAESALAVQMNSIHYHLNRTMEDAPSYATVQRAMPDLVEKGLICKPESDKHLYEITDRGQAYLAGDLDAGDLE